MPSLADHLKPGTPKKILSLDGGGIRGALTLGYLKKIETIIREKYDQTLHEYFDLIGGTSTGAIIASALATGMPVDEIRDNYMKLGEVIFKYSSFIYKLFPSLPGIKSKFDHKGLEKKMGEFFGDITMGSPEIKTGLCIVAKRADTNSVWPITNHPEGQFFDSPQGRNKNILLRNAIRASTAAPTYFKPMVIDVGDGIIAPFIDGSLSMANNPALILLKVAALKGFPFKWPMGEDKLSIVSVGTGYSVYNKHIGEITKAWLTTWAKDIPDILMLDASWHNQTMLQWMSNSPTAKAIDMEMGDLSGDLICGKPLLKYLRYNFALTVKDLEELQLPGRQFNAKMLADLAEISHVQNKELLYQIGEKAAQTQVMASHFD